MESKKENKVRKINIFLAFFLLLAIQLPLSGCFGEKAQVEEVSKNGLLKVEGKLDTEQIDPITAVFPDGTILIDGRRMDSREFDAKHPNRPPRASAATAIELYNPVEKNSSFVYAPIVSPPGERGMILANGQYLFLGKPEHWCFSHPEYHCNGNTAGYLFNLESRQFTAINNFNPWRSGFTLLPLPDGRVLIIGGSGAELGKDRTHMLTSLQFYDPESGVFTNGGELPFPLGERPAISVDDSHVLILGYFKGQKPPFQALLYDTNTHKIKTIGKLMRSDYHFSSLLNLDSERVFIAGLNNFVYNWKTGQQEIIGEGPKGAEQTVFLSDKRALVFGGKDVAIVDPFSKSIKVIDELIHWRIHFGAVMGRDQKIYILGGQEFRENGRCCKSEPLHEIEVLDYQELKKRGI